MTPTPPIQTPPPDTAPARSQHPAPPTLFLASRSPRRQQLLTSRGYTFDADHPGFEDGELHPGTVTPHQWVASLAYLKAVAGLERWRARRSLATVILGADTTCVLDGRMIGTPLSPAQAAHMIRAFTNRTHHVITAVALLCPTTRIRHLFTDQATVALGPLSDTQISDYIESGLWQGKAGAYNLSERIDAGWPLSFEGDPTSIMGLPMIALERHLAQFQSRQSQTNVPGISPIAQHHPHHPHTRTPEPGTQGPRHTEISP